MKRPSILLPFLFTLSFTLSGCHRHEPYEYLYQAESFTEEKKYSEAIAAYEKHIAFRKSLKNRPEWENPSFYLLHIGDIHLEQGDVDQALEVYDQAAREKVQAGLVADRYRLAAAKLEDDGKLEEAFSVLERYREKDPLLFDTALDRLAKKIVQEEQHAAEDKEAK